MDNSQGFFKDKDGLRPSSWAKNYVKGSNISAKNDGSKTFDIDYAELIMFGKGGSSYSNTLFKAFKNTKTLYALQKKIYEIKLGVVTDKGIKGQVEKKSKETLKIPLIKTKHVIKTTFNNYMKTYHVDSTKTVVPIKGNDKVLKRKFDSIKHVNANVLVCRKIYVSTISKKRKIRTESDIPH